ncbi:JmjC domain-containing histone demethylation protein 1 [Irineochytrium annulatum]|nr:JmjC domain-containing histone demethylation protein 1 [Irineochytrium annulatum]
MINYSELNHGAAEDEKKWVKLLSTKRFVPNKFKRLLGHEATAAWAKSTGIREPVIIEDPDGLGMIMPSSSLTVSQVADACGRDRVIEVMEVSTQSERQMTLEEWSEYFATPEEKRKRLLNILRPQIVRDLDWIDTVWPSRKEMKEYPRVQLYCLMSVKDSYTECLSYRMIIPTGWIHSVYTPQDSIVIGGNFIHGLNIGGQFDIYNIENKTGVPLKFRFPYFIKMQWYAARNYLAILRKNPDSLSNWELEGLIRLAEFLLSEVEILSSSGGIDKARLKFSRQSVPKGFKKVPKLVASFIYSIIRAQMRRPPMNRDSQLILARLGQNTSLRMKDDGEFITWSDGIDTGGVDWKSDESEVEYKDSDDEGLSPSEDEAAGKTENEDDFDRNGDDAEEKRKRRHAASAKRKRFKGVSGFVDDLQDGDYSEATDGAKMAEGHDRDESLSPPPPRPRAPVVVVASEEDDRKAPMPSGHYAIAPRPTVQPAALKPVKKPANVFSRLTKRLNMLKSRK